MSYGRSTNKNEGNGYQEEEHKTQVKTQPTENIYYPVKHICRNNDGRTTTYHFRNTRRNIFMEALFTAYAKKIDLYPLMVYKYTSYVDTMYLNEATNQPYAKGFNKDMKSNRMIKLK